MKPQFSTTNIHIFPTAIVFWQAVFPIDFPANNETIIRKTLMYSQLCRAALEREYGGGFDPD